MTPSISPVSLQSPFALMFPEAVEAILDRAEHMNLPRTKYSPLSKPAPWGRVRSELVDFDAAVDADDSAPCADADVPACVGRPETDDTEEDFDARR